MCKATLNAIVTSYVTNYQRVCPFNPLEVPFLVQQVARKFITWIQGLVSSGELPSRQAVEWWALSPSECLGMGWMVWRPGDSYLISGFIRPGRMTSTLANIEVANPRKQLVSHSFSAREHSVSCFLSSEWRTCHDTSRQIQFCNLISTDIVK